MSVISHCYSVMINRSIIAPGHGKEVVYGINTIDKHYIYQLMYNVQLPGSNIFYSHILMQYSTQNNDVSPAKELQKHLYKEHLKYGVIGQVKFRKKIIKRKCTDREYHVQDNSDVAHK